MSLFCEAFLPEQQLKESEFVRVLTNIAAKLTLVYRGQSETGLPAIDLRFMLPAGEEVPDFTGMRLHSWDSQGQRLLIESAVPVQAINARNCGDYIVAVMQDAVDNAGDFFAEQSVTFNPAWHHQVIAGLGVLPLH